MSDVRWVELGRPLPPFLDIPADCPVLGETLREATARAAREVPAPVGLTWVVGDHTWVTPDALRRFAAVCPPTGGVLSVGGRWAELTGPLQGLKPEGELLRYPVALAPAGTDPTQALAELPAIPTDLAVSFHDTPARHPAFEHAMEPVPETAAMVHTITHWSHLLRVNLYAMIANSSAEGQRLSALPAPTRWYKLLLFMLRVRSLEKYALARGISHTGAGCDIHPTATIEASWVGDGVTIGPHAVVRSSWIGDGVHIGEHAQVLSTVARPGAQLARGVMSNFCLVLEGALVSPGSGHQSSVFGRDCFLAHGVTCYDLSFGSEIRVQHEGQTAASGRRFLGVAVGHRARIGPHVIINFGEAVPNDAFLLVDPNRVFRHIPADLPAGEPMVVRGGAIVPAKDPS